MRLNEKKEQAAPKRFWKVENLKACLFDFGGTLDADGITWQDNFYRLYRKHGIHPDREKFRQAFYHSDDTLTESRALDGQGLRRTIEEQVAGVFGHLGLTNTETQMKAIVEDFLAGMNESIEKNRPLLNALNKRYTLGIVSNFYGNLERICEDLGIRDFFRCIIDSNREGVIKPDPRIFQAALERLGLAVEQAVFVGDNPYRDMQGARGVGMPHIWLTGEREEETRPCCPGDPVIRSLEELGPLLLNGKGAP